MAFRYKRIAGLSLKQTFIEFFTLLVEHYLFKELPTPGSLFIKKTITMLLSYSQVPINNTLQRVQNFLRTNFNNFTSQSTFGTLVDQITEGQNLIISLHFKLFGYYLSVVVILVMLLSYCF